MLGTRRSEQLHPIWFKAVLLSFVLRENILLVCGLSAMGCKCYFSRFHLDQHQLPIPSFHLQLCQNNNREVLQDQFGGIWKCFLIFQVFEPLLPIPCSWISNTYRYLCLFCSGMETTALLCPPCLPALQRCSELTQSTVLRFAELTSWEALI